MPNSEVPKHSKFLGQWLCAKRRALGMRLTTAESLAGIREGELIAIENGWSPIPVNQFIKLTVIYKVPTNEVIESISNIFTKNTRTF